MSELTPKQIAWRKWADANRAKRAAYFKQYEATPARRAAKRERMTLLSYLPYWRHARVMTRCRLEAIRIRQELGWT